MYVDIYMYKEITQGSNCSHRLTRFSSAMTRLLFLLVTLAVVYFNVADADQINDTDRLYNDMIVASKYNRRTRPVRAKYTPVNVNITFNMVTIQSFNELDGELTVVGVFQLSWYDERIVWDPAKYDGTYTILVPQVEVWYPPAFLTNPLESVEKIGQVGVDVRYSYTGMAIWVVGDVFKSSCEVDMSFYPYDVQTCTMQYAAVGHAVSEIQFFSPKDRFDREYFHPNGEWEFLDSTITVSDIVGFSSFRLQLRMKRRSDFYIMNIIIPVVLLLVMNVCVFILPAESGEKVSYAITVLLALAVYMTLISDHMPRISEPMSYISYFLLFSLLLSAVMCILTIYILRVYHRDRNIPVPGFLCSLVNCMSCSKWRKRNPELYISNHHHKTQRRMERYTESVRNRETTWIDVSKAVDILLFVIFIVIIFVTVICFFVPLSHNFK